MFKSTVMTCAARVCEYKSIGRKKRGSTLGNEKIKEMVRKLRLFEIYVTNRNERNREEYRQKNRLVLKLGSEVVGSNGAALFVNENSGSFK